MSEHVSSSPPYFLTTVRACAVLHEAMAQAIADLPTAIKTQHWMASKHSPAAWRAVEHWYRGQLGRDPLILDTLSNLALLSDALACIASVVTPIRTDAERPLDLTLRKQKRVETR